MEKKKSEKRRENLERWSFGRWKCKKKSEGVLGLRMRRKVWGNGGGTPLLFMSSRSPRT